MECTGYFDQNSKLFITLIVTIISLNAAIAYIEENVGIVFRKIVSYALCP
jgi:hypothetical protein